MFLKIKQYLDFNRTKCHEKLIDIEEIKQCRAPIKIFDVEISWVDFKEEKEKKLEKCIQS